jgi:hypothetical protein
MASDLVTLAEYKAYAGITSTTQDAAIKSIIPKASALAKSTCRRAFNDFVSDAKTDVFASGSETVYLAEFPILSVSSVEYSSDYGLTYTALVEYTDYVVDADNGSITFLNWTIYPKQINAFKVVYTAGFEVIPEDIKVAVLDLVTYYLKADMAVKSQRDAGSNTVQIEYITKNTLPSHIQRVFDLYLANVS